VAGDERHVWKPLSLGAAQADGTSAKTDERDRGGAMRGAELRHIESRVHCFANATLSNSTCTPLDVTPLAW